MSQQQLSALIAQLKEDPGLRKSLGAAPNLDSAIVISREAGFDVCKDDWNKYQSELTSTLSDAELESVTGGKNNAITKVSCDKYCPDPAPAA
jgi:predicted ribosomally synthesized peptide with nif11-like leader